MTTWTATARHELERHLAGLRPALAGSGADPDEVLDDMRRHVAEEVAAARLRVVTEEDVRRLVGRVAPTFPFVTRRSVLGEKDTGTEGESGKADSRVRPPSGGRRWRVWGGWGSWMIAIFGVIIPLGTLVFEWTTRVCAAEFFDPLPTVWHVVLVGMVPVANVLGLVPGDRLGKRGRRLRWWMNGASIGVSAVYCVPFLPLMPWAVVGIVFGLGLLPLAPLFGLAAAGSLRRRMRRELRESGTEDEDGRWPREGWIAAVVSVLLLLVYLTPGVVTRHQARVALRDDAADSDAAVRWLRRWGDRGILLREAYGERRETWGGVAFAPLPTDGARELYFRVTGEPFNAVPPPRTVWSRRNRGWLSEVETGGVEWDTALGSEAVAGRVRGLSLAASRMDAMADADAAWSYVEWTMEFRNDHERLQREARAQIQLPPGGVVSRLTLWVNGEEREAVFAGRGQVREAYQQVAVAQRRDPVLVTTSGPDRVLMQCFPIQPGGGTMKVRLGITAPLVPKGGDEAAMLWPEFVERNFGQDRSLAHSVWLDAPQAPVAGSGAWTAARGAGDRVGYRNAWSDASSDRTRWALTFRRNPGEAERWAPDRKSGERRWVRQRIVASRPESVGRIAVVLDGSKGMEEVASEVATVLARVPSGPELAVFVCRDGVTRLPGDPRSAEAVEGLRKLRCEGGQDALAGLETAWDWVTEARSGSGAVVWVHGPQPVRLRSAESLRQRLERQSGLQGPRILDVAVRPGPNRVLEHLDGLEAVVGVPRLGSFVEDFERCVSVLARGEPRWDITREAVDRTEPGPAPEIVASTHVTRLWALDEIRRLVRSRRTAEAVSLAGRHQLVTPVSGAVVLETKAQYDAAGLTPVDPTTVPVVPEPRVGWLMVAGAILLFVGRRRRGAGGTRAAVQ